jgi:hypothetical protein
VLSTFLAVDGIRVLKKQCLDLGVALCRAGPTTLVRWLTGNNSGNLKEGAAGPQHRYNYPLIDIY